MALNGDMVPETTKLLTPKQARYMTEVAERARAALSRFAGYEVGYDATGLQFLDEWVDRHLRQNPHPSQETYLLWVSFLGEVFRRRHEGEWVMQEGGEKGELAVVCPKEDGSLYTVDVSGQVSRRIVQGIAASLSLFYLTTAIEFRAV
jgi:hypothetical protein